MLPSKRNGFRLLKIAPLEFFWKFSKGIDVRPKDNPSNRLKVDIGWYDEWFYMNDRENRPEPFEPQEITPKFVRAMIEWALNNGWDVASQNKYLQIRYHQG
jgi:hypothetical protein